MKRLKFYVCPGCGNIITAMGDAQVSCCGAKLEALIPKPCDETHRVNIENIEDDYYITFSHEMIKEHYLNFIAFVSFDRMLCVRLYPEQSGEVRIAGRRKGKLYICCSKHGLWEQTIK